MDGAVGAQMFFHSPGDESLEARLSNVEVHNAGQSNTLGRYAVHYHNIGTVTASYVHNVSIHHSHNRGVAIHGVRHLRIEHTVAFDVKGHTFFVEDGIEVENVIAGNLAVHTRPSASLLNTDQTPASFWVVNPYNYVRNNVAAGSSHYGYAAIR